MNSQKSFPVGALAGRYFERN